MGKWLLSPDDLYPQPSFAPGVFISGLFDTEMQPQSCKVLNMFAEFEETLLTWTREHRGSSSAIGHNWVCLLKLSLAVSLLSKAAPSVHTASRITRCGLRQLQLDAESKVMGTFCLWGVGWAAGGGIS